MADRSVRPAAPGDAAAVARVQSEVWARVYTGLLPPALLAAVGDRDAVATWEHAIATPPSARHRVLVALAGEQVVGFAALAPAVDPDLSPALDTELHSLCVAPEHTGAGHGSRLVNAAADVLRGADAATLHVWLTDREPRLRTFLERAGWAGDGASRRLDLRGDGEVLVDQVRLSTVIADAG